MLHVASFLSCDEEVANVGLSELVIFTPFQVHPHFVWFTALLLDLCTITIRSFCLLLFFSICMVHTVC